MHIAVYLPTAFYSAIASTIVETLQAVNDVSRSQVLSFEFVSRQARAVSKSGIAYPAKTKPSRKMDVLFLLAGAGPEISQTLQLLDEETKQVMPLITRAHRQGAIIAATCGAAYLLAGSGLLDGKRSTVLYLRRVPYRRHTPSP